MPVLPAVPSTSVAPGRMSPRCSAASIIFRPMRSLIDPPGFMHSSFRNSSHEPVSRCWALTIGVSPMSCRTFCWTVMERLGVRESGGFYTPGAAAGPGNVFAGRAARREVQAAATRRGGPPPPQGKLVLAPVVHPGQLVLREQLLPLHARDRGVVERKASQLGVEHLLVEFAVSMVELAEFGVVLHQRFEFVLRLPFKHGFDLLQKRERPGLMGPGRGGVSGQVAFAGGVLVRRARDLSGSGSVGGDEVCFHRPGSVTRRKPAGDSNLLRGPGGRKHIRKWLIGRRKHSWTGVSGRFRPPLWIQ